MSAISSLSEKTSLILLLREGTTAKPPKARVNDTKNEQAAYQSAFDLLRALRYEKATQAFRQFLNDYPEGRYAHIAQYWLAETSYHTRKYDIAVQDIASVEVPTHVPYGVWRSVASSQHGFFIESFVDELDSVSPVMWIWLIVHPRVICDMCFACHDDPVGVLRVEAFQETPGVEYEERSSINMECFHTNNFLNLQI